VARNPASASLVLARAGASLSWDWVEPLPPDAERMAGDDLAPIREFAEFGGPVLLGLFGRLVNEAQQVKARFGCEQDSLNLDFRLCPYVEEGGGRAGVTEGAFLMDCLPPDQRLSPGGRLSFDEKTR
jgi:hypothetical protein